MYRMRLHTLGALSIIVFVWAFHPQLVFVGADVVQHLGANVGISVGIEETPYSKLAQEIGDKQIELEAREQALVAAEERLSRSSSSQVFSIEWYVTLMAFILLILVIINFYLDFRHREQPRL